MTIALDHQHGESCIRVPFKGNWQRDLLSVRGDIIDYCVIGETKAQVLHAFQRSQRPQAKSF